ncbi:hypothetical protein LZ31DRAFT_331854 [Colletotrichum somersetense]|nr:hypothetical protein LZ31DRAFT_331854 [Colletotrichum somersetense]
MHARSMDGWVGKLIGSVFLVFMFVLGTFWHYFYLNTVLGLLFFPRRMGHFVWSAMPTGSYLSYASSTSGYMPLLNCINHSLVDDDEILYPRP